MIFVPAALAGTYEVPTPYATVADALDAAGGDTDITILIDPTTTDAGDPVAVRNRTITIRSTSDTLALIPAMSFTGSSCDVTLENVRVELSTTSTGSDFVSYAYGIFVDGCAAASIDGLETALDEGDDLVLLNTDTTVANFTPTGTAFGAAFYMKTSDGPHTLSIRDSTFVDLPAGAVALQNNSYGDTLTVTIADTVFSGNEGSSFADLLSNSADISATNTRFTDGTSPYGYPITVNAGNFACDTCIFDRRGSSTGPMMYLGSTVPANTVRIENSWLGSADDPSKAMFTFGAGANVFLSNVTAEMSGGAGTLLSVDQGMLTLDGVDIRGDNSAASGAVVHLSRADGVITNSRLCAVAGSAGIEVSGGIVSLQDTILQGLDVNYGVQLSAYGLDDGTFSFINNTFVDAGAVGAVGGKLTNSSTLINNLFADNAAGIVIDGDKAPGNEFYNLRV